MCPSGDEASTQHPHSNEFADIIAHGVRQRVLLICPNCPLKLRVCVLVPAELRRGVHNYVPAIYEPVSNEPLSIRAQSDRRPSPKPSMRQHLTTTSPIESIFHNAAPRPRPRDRRAFLSACATFLTVAPYSLALSRSLHRRSPAFRRHHHHAAHLRAPDHDREALAWACSRSHRRAPPRHRALVAQHWPAR